MNTKLDDQEVCGQATEQVLHYLAYMEARDLDSARCYLHTTVHIEFPGGAMSCLDDVVAWASERYRRLTKRISACEALRDGPRVVVYCRGDLSGETLAGEAFTGVRFIDRFELENGLIVSQQVWNDFDTYRLATRSGI